MTVTYGFFRSKGPRNMGNLNKRGRPIEGRIRIEQQYGALGDWRMLSARDLAHWLDAGESTAHRWVQRDRIPDPDKLRLVAILALGDMPWRGWEHWRMEPETGRLIAPNGYSFMPGELAWLGLIKEQNRELQRKITRLETEREELRAEIERLNFSQNENGRVVRFPGSSGA